MPILHDQNKFLITKISERDSRHLSLSRRSRCARCGIEQEFAVSRMADRRKWIAVINWLGGRGHHAIGGVAGRTHGGHASSTFVGQCGAGPFCLKPLGEWEDPHQLLGVDRTDTADRAGCEIFLDSVDRARRRRTQEPGLELLAVGTSFIHSPDAVIHSVAAIVAAYPTTVTRSRCPRALARKTQNPLSALW